MNAPIAMPRSVSVTPSPAAIRAAFAAIPGGGVVAISVILLGNAYATERQIEIHQLQTDLLQAQSHYASQVAALTDSTAPARIAARVPDLHLVPGQVTQISVVPLDRALPLPTLNVPYTPISRQYP